MYEVLRQRMESENMQYVSIDLFSGPGGLCTGFKWAGILPLIAVEWTDSTIHTYANSHNAEIFELTEYITKDGENSEYLHSFMNPTDRTLLIHGDINLVSSEIIMRFLLERYGIDSINENIDVVTGGAPCESFSMAGRRTVGDERDDLFSNIIRIARTTHAKMILFENVKGLLSKPKDGVKGGMYQYICERFEENNGDVQYKLVTKDPNELILRACDYGVPQVRERIFLVAIRVDLANKVQFRYPQKKYGPGRELPYVTVREAISDLPRVETGEECTIYQNQTEFLSENQRNFINIVRGFGNAGNHINNQAPQFLIESGAYTENSISSHKGPGHIQRKLDLIRLIQPNESMKSTFERLSRDGVIDQFRNLFPNKIYAARNRRLKYDEASFTVTSHCLDEMLHPELNRAVTPREAARLQSFPDWYQFEGPYVQFHGDRIQDRYEQIGDAIPPLLAFALGTEIKSTLNMI